MPETESPVWREDGEMYHDAGDVGGDIQCGKAYDRRFVHNLLPGRLVTITAYPIKGDGSDPMPPEDAPIYLQWQTEMMVCRDTDDPGGTEVWSDTEYSDLPEAYTGSYTTVERAELFARNLVMSVIPGRDIGWDGAPEIELNEKES